jgi:galactose mutarotase-like enzyme
MLSETILEAEPIHFGGQPAVTISRPQTGDVLQLLSMTLLPGLGMNMWDITAYVPGKGNFRVLASTPLDQANAFFNAPGDPHGTRPFREGSALLVPFVNRIRGTLSADGKTIETVINGRTFHLPANFSGSLPTAELHAIHGYVFTEPFEDVQVEDHAASLDARGIELEITATNVGQEILPMGISWHPYFDLPSGDRRQARVHIPAASYAEADNYDNVFPTGKVYPVLGTRFDLSAPEGAALGDYFYDDNFLDLQRDASGHLVVEITDPLANYGVRIVSPDKEISAVQMYAPTGKNFVVIEQQFNLANPYGKEWNGRDTGMVNLEPGESVSYHQRIELFTPSK